MGKLHDRGIVRRQSPELKGRRKEIQASRLCVFRERFGLQIERSGSDLNGPGVDIDAVQVVLQDRLGNLFVGDELSTVSCLLSIERRQEVERDHQKVPTATCWIEQLDGFH